MVPWWLGGWLRISAWLCRSSYVRPLGASRPRYPVGCSCVEFSTRCQVHFFCPPSRAVPFRLFWYRNGVSRQFLKRTPVVMSLHRCLSDMFAICSHRQGAGPTAFLVSSVGLVVGACHRCVSTVLRLRCPHISTLTLSGWCRSQYPIRMFESLCTPSLFLFVLLRRKEHCKHLGFRL
jgi:hypothetical protein